MSLEVALKDTFGNEEYLEPVINAEEQHDGCLIVEHIDEGTLKETEYHSLYRITGINHV